MQISKIKKKGFDVALTSLSNDKIKIRTDLLYTVWGGDKIKQSIRLISKYSNCFVRMDTHWVFCFFINNILSLDNDEMATSKLLLLFFPH